MRTFLGNSGGLAFVRPVLRAVPLFLLLFAAISHAQCWSPVLPPTGGGTANLLPQYWAPGQSYNVAITIPASETSTYGSFYQFQQNNFSQAALYVITAAAYNTGNTANYLTEDPYVTVTNLAYVSPTEITFTATVAANAPTENDAFNLVCFADPYDFTGSPAFISITPCAIPVTPTISSISPSTIGAGQATTITINGSGFTPPGGCGPAVNVFIGGQGVPLSIKSITAGTITAIVTPNPSKTAETATVQVSNPDYNNNVWLTATGTPKVSPCTIPTVSSISSNVWFAGQSYNNVIIKGTNFTTAKAGTTTCPATSVNVTTPSGAVVALGAVTVNSATQLTIANVTLPATETTEGVTVAVSGEKSPRPNADVLEIPTITWTSDPDGSNPTICGPNSTLPNPNAVVGRQIVLTTTPTAATLAALPVKLTFASTNPATWTVNGGTNIAGYTVVLPTAEAPSVSLGEVNLLTPQMLSANNLSFYSVDSPAFVGLTYRYCISGQTTCPEATATFYMTGPNGATMAVTFGPLTPGIFNSASPPMFGVGNGSISGIVFTASDESDSPAGQFSFVQTINYDLTKRTDSVTGTCDETTGTGLDTVYPYGNLSSTANSATTGDGPSTGFFVTDEEIITTERFTMYAMWTPDVTPSSPAVIPVPIGSINWQWYADAVQTSSNSPYAWIMNPNSNVTNPTSSAGAFSPSLTYPTWGSAGYSGTHPCVPEGSQ